MTDESLDPLDDLAAYASELGFELDTSELEPEPLPDFEGEAISTRAFGSCSSSSAGR